MRLTLTLSFLFITIFSSFSQTFESMEPRVFYQDDSSEEPIICVFSNVPEIQLGYEDSLAILGFDIINGTDSGMIANSTDSFLVDTIILTEYVNTISSDFEVGCADVSFEGFSQAASNYLHLYNIDLAHKVLVNENLGGAGYISGTLTEDGRNRGIVPMGEVVIILVDEEDDSEILKDISDEQGFFEFKYVTEGEYTLRFKEMDIDGVETGQAEIIDEIIAITAQDTMATGLEVSPSVDSTLTVIDDKFSSLNFKIYPNPGVEVVYVDLTSVTDDIESVEVYNLLGQKIYEDDSPSKMKEITTNGWASMIYTIQINTSKGSYSQQLSVDR